MRKLPLLSLWLLCVSSLGYFAHAGKPANNRLPDSVIVALAEVRELTIYSLAPDAPLDPRKESFHFVTVLGKAALTDARDLETVRTTLSASVAAYDEDDATFCFRPRHGFRLEGRGQVTDIEVCFECAKMMVIQEKTSLGPIGVRGSPQNFDDILKRLGIPIPPPAPVREAPPKAGAPGIPGLVE